MNGIKRNLTHFLMTTITASSEGSEYILENSFRSVFIHCWQFYISRLGFWFTLCAEYKILKPRISLARVKTRSGASLEEWNHKWADVQSYLTHIQHQDPFASRTSNLTNRSCKCGRSQRRGSPENVSSTTAQPCLLPLLISKVNTSICILGESHLEQCL